MRMGMGDTTTVTDTPDLVLDMELDMGTYYVSVSILGRITQCTSTLVTIRTPAKVLTSAT